MSNIKFEDFLDYDYLPNKKAVEILVRYGELSAMQFNKLAEAERLPYNVPEKRKELINKLGSHLAGKQSESAAESFMEHLENIQKNAKEEGILGSPEEVKAVAKNYCEKQNVAENRIYRKTFVRNLIAYSELISIGYREGVKQERKSSLRDHNEEKREEGKARAKAMEKDEGVLGGFISTLSELI